MLTIKQIIKIITCHNFKEKQAKMFRIIIAEYFLFIKHVKIGQRSERPENITHERRSSEYLKTSQGATMKLSMQFYGKLMCYTLHISFHIKGLLCLISQILNKTLQCKLVKNGL